MCVLLAHATTPVHIMNDDAHAQTTTGVCVCERGCGSDGYATHSFNNTHACNRYRHSVDGCRWLAGWCKRVTLFCCRSFAARGFLIRSSMECTRVRSCRQFIGRHFTRCNFSIFAHREQQRSHVVVVVIAVYIIYESEPTRVCAQM